MGFKTHVILEVDSRERTSGTAGDFHIVLNHTIDLNRKRQYFCRLENIKLPTSFYNIHSLNNTFKVIEDPAGTPDPISITIPEGNYTESELRSTVAALLNAATLNVNTYAITFDTITGKMTITSDTTEFLVNSITNGSTANRLFGFVDSQYTSVSRVLTSVSHVELSARRFLTIHTNLGSNNLYSKQHLKNIGTQIPITVGRSSIQFTDNHNGVMVKLESRHNIKDIQFSVRDSANTIVDFNGVDWSAEFVLYEFRD